MASKSTPGGRANRLVTTGNNTFGSGALGGLAAFCQRHIHSGTAVRFILGHDKKMMHACMLRCSVVSDSLQSHQAKHRRRGFKPWLRKITWSKKVKFALSSALSTHRRKQGKTLLSPLFQFWALSKYTILLTSFNKYSILTTYQVQDKSWGYRRGKKYKFLPLESLHSS